MKQKTEIVSQRRLQ